MSILIPLKIIESKLRKNDFVFSNHFLEQCDDRLLKIDLIKNILRKNDLLGILKQSHTTYKLWFGYSESKDLNIVVDLSKSKLRLITVFPSRIERRRR